MRKTMTLLAGLLGGSLLAGPALAYDLDRPVGVRQGDWNVSIASSFNHYDVRSGGPELNEYGLSFGRVGLMVVDDLRLTGTVGYALSDMDLGDVSLTEHWLEFDLQATYHFDIGATQRFVPYAGGGGGGVYHRSSFTVDPDDPTVDSTSETDKGFWPSVHAAFGFEVFLVDDELVEHNASAFVEYRPQYIWTKASDMGNIFNHQVLFGIGLHW